MADSQQQQQPALSALGPHLLVRPSALEADQVASRAIPETRPPQPRAIDVDLRLHRPEVRPAEEDEEDVIDLHPVTSALVPSMAPYQAPPPLSQQPLTALQGNLPQGLTLTLEEMEPRFKSRVPLRLVTTSSTTTTTTTRM